MGIQAIGRENGLTAITFAGDGFAVGAAEILSHFAADGAEWRAVSQSETGMTVFFDKANAEKAWKTAVKIRTEQ